MRKAMAGWHAMEACPKTFVSSFGAYFAGKEEQSRRMLVHTTQVNETKSALIEVQRKAVSESISIKSDARVLCTFLTLILSVSKSWQRLGKRQEY